MIIDRTDTNGVETPSKREVIQFDSTSGLTVVTLTRNADSSGTDQDHAVGAIVEFGPDVLWAQSVIDGLVEILDPATGTVDTTKVVTPTGASTLTNKTYNGGTTASLTQISSNLITPYVQGGTFASLPVFSGKPRFMSGQLAPFVTVTDGANMWINFAQGNKFTTTIATSGEHAFLATNATVGDVAMLQVNYASTISLSLKMLATSASITWSGGSAPTATNTTLKSDMFGFVCIGTLPKFAGFIVGQNY